MNQQPVSAVLLVNGANQENGAAAISRSIWTWTRLAGGAVILAVLVWRVGAGPLVDGLRLTTGWALAAAVAITSLTTLCCAWRWSLVAGGLGVEMPLRTAVAAYYRSQFLNATLPGGVVGDVHRAVRHGRDVGDLGRSLRARIARAVTTDLRDAVLAPRAWPGIVLASAVAVLGHAAVFLVAVRATGMDVSPGRLLPLALVVLLAAAVPTNIAGWGPREGAAAWAFGSVGLSAAEGVTVAVVYGVLALVATLPGAVVLVVGRQRARDGARGLTEVQPERVGSVVHA